MKQGVVGRGDSVRVSCERFWRETLEALRIFGKIIELDRSAGAPADVLMNGRLLAQVEIVVVDHDYAVRITRILDLAAGQS